MKELMMVLVLAFIHGVFAVLSWREGLYFHAFVGVLCYCGWIFALAYENMTKLKSEET